MRHNTEQLLFDCLSETARSVRLAFEAGDTRQALVLLRGVQRDAVEAERVLLGKLSDAELAYSRQIEAAMARRAFNVKGTA